MILAYSDLLNTYLTTLSMNFLGVSVISLTHCKGTNYFFICKKLHKKIKIFFQFVVYR